MIRPLLHDSVEGEFTCILFDMDGTLVDSAEGVTGSAAAALEAVGAEVPGPAELLSFVGPPMLESFRSLPGMDEVRAQLALKHYRSIYAQQGAGQSRLFDGVVELLQQLQGSLPMAVATSKIEDQALRVAVLLGIDRHFVDICGASDAVDRSRKKDVIQESLRRLQSKGIDVARPVMVGDRMYDVEGAAAFGIPTVFAQWGYGSQEERSSAAAIAAQPNDVASIVFGQ
ncbi:HAD hydrolase-like protein [Arthrobacter sp. CJ23]|uniref:HAD hydrolase-like protein n=1 Tax=Arthrobacter sp. CJ23 TaxID=2972479 RepID=UPI00215B91C3|nr:HAD hydrolase-like protein [Arthrobacter sp. CJ23]UVJ41183.1 HAD hydrolase-like protein [Arthrobacter sp. CJ23]